MVSGSPTHCSIVISSTQSAVEGVCKEVISELIANNFSQQEIFAVHLAIEEALINAIKHGNKMEPEKDVKVGYSVNGDTVDIVMTDEGEGFNPDSIPDPRSGDNIYRPNGRGLLLIRSYMDVVEFNKQGNSVHMVKYKEKKGQDVDHG